MNGTTYSQQFLVIRNLPYLTLLHPLFHPAALYPLPLCDSSLSRATKLELKVSPRIIREIEQAKSAQDTEPIRASFNFPGSTRITYAKQFLFEEKKGPITKLKAFLHNAVSPKGKKSGHKALQLNSFVKPINKLKPDLSTISPAHYATLSATLRAPWKVFGSGSKGTQQKNSPDASAQIRSTALTPKRPKSSGVGVAKLKQIYAKSHNASKNKVLVSLYK